MTRARLHRRPKLVSRAKPPCACGRRGWVGWWGGGWGGGSDPCARDWRGARRSRHDRRSARRARLHRGLGLDGRPQRLFECDEEERGDHGGGHRSVAVARAQRSKRGRGGGEEEEQRRGRDDASRRAVEVAHVDRLAEAERGERAQVGGGRHPLAPRGHKRRAGKLGGAAAPLRPRGARELKLEHERRDGRAAGVPAARGMAGGGWRDGRRRGGRRGTAGVAGRGGG